MRSKRDYKSGENGQLKQVGNFDGNLSTKGLTGGDSKPSMQCASESGFNQKAKSRLGEGMRTKSEEEFNSRDLQRRDQGGKIKLVNITDIGVYEGNCNKNNIPHGYGKLKLKNGDFYEGDFELGCFSGEGRMLTADGCEYRGFWQNNCRNGKGKETWTNGNKFTGEFMADKKHGYGKHKND